MECDNELRARIERIDNEFVWVSVIHHGSCSSCGLSASCSAIPHDTDLLRVYCGGQICHLGEEVILLESSSLRYKAVTTAFVIPCLILVLSIVLVQWLDGNELSGALLSLVMLAIYYTILYLRRKKLNRKYHYRLKLQKEQQTEIIEL